MMLLVKNFKSNLRLQVYALTSFLSLIFNESSNYFYHIASFGRTLLHGIEKFKRTVQDEKGKIFSGHDAFVSWDTFGFPLDLNQLMAEERGLVVDVEGFNIAMSEARD